MAEVEEPQPASEDVEMKDNDNNENDDEDEEENDENNENKEDNDDTEVADDNNNNNDNKERSWNDNFQALKLYKKRNGHPNPVEELGQNQEDYQLAIWLNEQRNRSREGVLEVDNARKLVFLGCEKIDLHLLKKRKRQLLAKNGGVAVDGSSSTSSRKRGRRSSNASGDDDGDVEDDVDDEYDDLDHYEFNVDEEFVLSPIPSKNKKRKEAPSMKKIRKRVSWEVRYAQLIEFKQKKGHANPAPSENKALAQWLANQRSDFRTGKISKLNNIKINKLRRLGAQGFGDLVDEDGFEDVEEEIVLPPDAAVEDEEDEDDDDDDDSSDDDQFIAPPVKKKKKSSPSKKVKLPQKRRREAPMIRKPSRTRSTWESRFEEFKAFVEREGHATPTKREEPRVAQWLANQRSDYRCGKIKVLTAHRVAMLRSLGAPGFGTEEDYKNNHLFLDAGEAAEAEGDDTMNKEEKDETGEGQDDNEASDKKEEEDDGNIEEGKDNDDEKGEDEEEDDENKEAEV